MTPRERWSRILQTVGYGAMILGAIDPMEGSLIIFPGAALVVVGTYLARADKRQLTYRLAVFLMIAFGVAALWGMSALGGFGGESGRSMWWGLVIVPYVVGWSMEVWGPLTPRWVSWSGIAVGLWYLALPLLILRRPLPVDFPRGPVILVAAIGLLTIAGCIYRLKERSSRPPRAA
jgi:hypothetical protein